MWLDIFEEGGFGVWLIGVLERNCLLDFPSTITFLQTKHFCRSHLPDEKASQTGNPSSDNVLDPILELKQRRIVREKKCSTFIDINSCLQRFETASMQCRMLKVNKIQLGFASRIPRLHFKQCVFVHLWICNWRFSSLFRCEATFFLCSTLHYEAIPM